MELLQSKLGLVRRMRDWQLERSQEDQIEPFNAQIGQVEEALEGGEGPVAGVQQKIHRLRQMLWLYTQAGESGGHQARGVLWHLVSLLPGLQERVWEKLQMAEFVEDAKMEELHFDAKTEELHEGAEQEELPDDAKTEELPDDAKTEELPEDAKQEELHEDADQEDLSYPMCDVCKDRWEKLKAQAEKWLKVDHMSWRRSSNAA